MPPLEPHEAPAEEAEGSHRRLLLIALRDSVVALPADSVVEVLPARPFARVPGAVPAVAGVVNRRGRMLTVVDLGLALGEHSTSTDEAHRVVVIGWRGLEIGLAVVDVLQITSEWWTESPADAVDTVEADEESVPSDPEGADAQGEQLRVVEPEEVLAPLFGGDDGNVDANATGKS